MAANTQAQAIYYFVMAMRIIWGTVLLGIPLFLYVSPLKQDKMIQSLLAFMLISICIGLSRADKAIAKLT